jgi:thiamine kinase-like enzyme
MFNLMRSILVSILIATNLNIGCAYADQIADAKQYAKAIPQLHGQKLEVAPLSGGLTNLIYLVKTDNNDKYVMRVFGSEAESLGVDPAQQAATAVVLGDIGVGPKVLYVSADKKKMLVEFAAGKPLSRAVYTESVRDALAAKIRTLHDKGNFSVEFDPFKSATKFRNSALNKSPEIISTFPISDLAHAQEIMCQIQHIIKQHSQRFKRSGHNDLHCGNILFNPANATIALIDLDYAGSADLFYDLAILANSLELNSNESKQLLDAYFHDRARTIRDEAHLEIMRLVSTYWNSMWYFSQVGSSTIAHDHLGSAKENLTAFLQQTKTAKFQQAMEVLS